MKTLIEVIEKPLQNCVHEDPHSQNSISLSDQSRVLFPLNPVLFPLGLTPLGSAYFEVHSRAIKSWALRFDVKFYLIG